MEIKQLDEFHVKSYDFVKVTDTGNVTEVMYMACKSKGNNIRKVSKEQYVDMRTGEVKDYRHTENRAQNKNELRKTFKKIRDLINCNTEKPEMCKWVTLTYAENMTDTDRLYNDMKIHIKALRRKYGKFEYIQVIEPQGRGAWHIHMIMIFPHYAPYIDNKDMSKIWKHGATDTRKLEENDNIGAYLSAYLGDVEIKDEQIVQGDVKEVKGKKYLKGGRLHMYPTGMNILRTSKGVKRPLSQYMTNEQAEKKVGSAKLTFEKTIQLVDEDSNFENTINYRYYNKKR